MTIKDKVVVGDQTLLLGDCLEVMPTLGDQVDMVLADPPYGTIKGIDGIKGVSGEVEWDTVIPHEQMWKCLSPIMRMNASCVLFGQDPFTMKTISRAHENIVFSYRMIWDKCHFASPLNARRAPVNYFEDIMVFFKKYDTLLLHPLRQYSRKIIEYIGKNIRQINADLGHRKAEHFFYTESSQFCICSLQAYTDLTLKYGLQKMDGFIEFDELRDINEQFNRQLVEQFGKRFNLSLGSKFKSNILKYTKDTNGLHPTQKPVALMEDLVMTYTNEGDTVLDFTMGSGTTGVACMNTGRKFIGIEQDRDYFQIACDRVQDTYDRPDLFTDSGPVKPSLEPAQEQLWGT